MQLKFHPWFRSESVLNIAQMDFGWQPDSARQRPPVLGQHGTASRASWQSHHVGAPASQWDVPARQGKLPCRIIYTASTSDDSIAFHWSLCILRGWSAKPKTSHQFWCSRSSQLCSVAEVIRDSSKFPVLDGLFQTTLPKTPVFWWWSELTDPHSHLIRDTPHIICPSHISQEQWHPYPNHVSFNLIVSHLTISWYYVWFNNLVCDLPWWFSLSLNRTIWPCLTIMWTTKHPMA